VVVKAELPGVKKEDIDVTLTIIPFRLPERRKGRRGSKEGLLPVGILIRLLCADLYLTRRGTDG